MSLRKILFSLAAFSLIFPLGILSVPAPVHADDSAAAVEARQQALQAELNALIVEIAEKQKQLDAKHGESASLQRDITILNGKIDQAKLQIKATDLALQRLQHDIGVKDKTIQTLTERIEKNQQSLADLLRKADQVEGDSLMEIMLNDGSISEAVDDINAYDTLKSNLHDLYVQITDEKGLNEDEKKALEQKREQEADAKAAMEAAKKKVEATQKEKANLLTVTKSQEKNYQLALADRQKKAASIRAALFALRDTAAIPFGTALQYATEAQSKTGIRPAFLLAILTQESNLGADVGKCYLTNPGTGAGANVSTGRQWPNVMKPSRDVPPFLEIMQNLGRDPLQTAVSCPIPSAGGYGGAMGPAQFIASTWKLFAGRLERALGHYADPWVPEDAFLASSMYLTDLGAVGSSYTSEIKAACKYYGTGGSACSYGKQVMAKAASIQTTMIDPLQNL